MIKIWSKVHCSFAANHMVTQLGKLGHDAILLNNDWDPKDDSLHILYQVSNMCNFPKNYILMQTEPWCSHWFNNDYVSSIIKNAVTVWDYSEDNQKHYNHHNKAIVTPGISPQPKVNKDIPNLFYGWIEGSKRREKKVKELAEKVPLAIVTNIVGQEMYSILSRTENVYNIHYQDNSPLELYRICESISHGCRVFTEHCDYFRQVTLGDNLEEIKMAIKSI